jgi:hypothetical protein
MVQIFVKFDGSPTLVLSLDNNYTISSKELYVKCSELFVKRFYKKSLEEAIYDGSANFIINSYMLHQCKMIKFRSNQYFNTNNLNNSTLYISFTSYYNDLTDEDKDSINGILCGYY